MREPGQIDRAEAQGKGCTPSGTSLPSQGLAAYAVKKLCRAWEAPTEEI